MDKKRLGLVRKIIQAGFGLLSNAHLSGFINGKIYEGPLKRFCVPGMNCYSCPGALGACPIGAMQASLAARKTKFPFYVLGYLALIGVFLGRFVCGWLCVFGLLQELLFKIPLKKLRIPEKADRLLRYGKYLVLLFLVILLPAFLRDEFGFGVPYFCKYLCPVGTLEGGIPLLLLNEGLRSAAHFLYILKISILLVLLLFAVLLHRPFCKYLCPLGAFYALFQKSSFLRLQLETKSCIHCGACERACGMQVNPASNPNSAECIRCGKCISVCPKDALSFRFHAGNPGDASLKPRKEKSSS